MATTTTDTIAEDPAIGYLCGDCAIAVEYNDDSGMTEDRAERVADWCEAIGNVSIDHNATASGMPCDACGLSCGPTHAVHAV